MLNLRAQASGVTFQPDYLGWSDPLMEPPRHVCFPEEGDLWGMCRS